MANVEESEVAAECEYRKEKGVAKWHEKFLVEYRGPSQFYLKNAMFNTLLCSIVVRVVTFGRSRIRIVRALFGRSRISNSWAAANNEYQKIRVFDIPGLN